MLSSMLSVHDRAIKINDWCMNVKDDLDVSALDLELLVLTFHMLRQNACWTVILF